MNLSVLIRGVSATAVLLAGSLYAADGFVPVAVIPFQERGDEVKDMGGKVTDLLFANLLTQGDMYLVEREDLKLIVEEQELNLSGVVNPAEAVQLGQLTGAKIIVTGSVLQVGEKLYCVAKIMGTETSRVIGQSVKGKFDDDLDGLVEELAKNVASAIEERSGDLVAKEVKRVDRLAAIKKAVGGGKHPTLVLDLPERHVGNVTSDPAAETELSMLAGESGFKILDSGADRADADVILVGEAFSEFAARHGNLVSVKARVEVKAVDRETGRVLAVDRQTSIAADLAEQIAAKSALAEAAGKIAERILPKLAK